MQLRAVPDDREAIRSQPVADWFGQGQRGGRGDSGVDRIAATSQDPQTGLGG
ncbi:hypothetical protein D9M69_641010 [compost metagenome]